VLAFRDALLATGFGDDHVAVLHDGRPETRYRPLKAHILRELDLLLDGMRAEDTLVVGLSGHGLQFKGEPVSYFVPVDARLADRGTLIALDGQGGLYECLKACPAKRKLLLVNACRNDPAVDLAFAAKKAELDDVDRDEVPEGLAAIYSCAAGQKSYYDPQRKRALFFDHVIRAWKGEYGPGGPVTLEAFFEQVAVKTKADANRTLGVSQVPQVKREYKGQWVIANPAKAPPVPAPPVPAPPAPPAAAEDELIGEMNFIRGPKGTFWMGWDSTNMRSQQMTIERDFELAAYTVTQGQWEAVMGSNPSYFSRKGKGGEKVKEVPDADLRRFPVETVTWDDVQLFLAKLNERQKGQGWSYRPPREAEWEYACRGAATTKDKCSFDSYFATPTNDLSSKQANFEGHSPAGNGAKGPYLVRPRAVGSYAPNKLGLYDMHGNIGQLCDDFLAPKLPQRVLRGGSWSVNGKSCRAASRSWSAPSVGSANWGFRLARVPSGG
jgi:formylglycine-generating enzyme required for sulfatase activity